ncbi:unnamed protein product [Gordionus sp. m RMFG-2023]|uniref:coiled-coil domain-containing protein 86-like n=1 Tax=Gordionus sp. m RMFG-2023 TaxID=3053472 RepID=UPI0030DF8179
MKTKKSKKIKNPTLSGIISDTIQSEPLINDKENKIIKDNQYLIYKNKNWKKSLPQPKFSTMRSGKAFHSKWSQKMENKYALSKVKEIQKQIEGTRKKSKEDARKCRELNLLKKKENERKGEVVQIIKDTTKIKKMKKKHLRNIEKRDILNY